MSGNVCRLCLSTDAPLRTIAGSPLQDIYEKLTEISLTTPHRPVVACYLCFHQLRKCYNLMVRSVKADEVLTQILRSGKVVDEEFVAMINRYQLNDGLGVTPIKLLSMTGTEHSLTKADVIEDPLSSQCRKEIKMDCRILLEPLKVEEYKNEGDNVKAVLEDVCDNENEGLINIKKEVLEETVDIERHELTEDDIKLEELEEVQGIDNEPLMYGEDTRQESEGGQVIENIETEGAAPSNKCKKLKKTEDILTPGRKNIIRKLKKQRALLEDTSRRSTALFGSTKKAAKNKHVVKHDYDTLTYDDNVSDYSNNDCNEYIISDYLDNDSIGTDTDVDDNSEHFTETITNDIDDVFGQNPLKEEIEHHDIERTSDRTSSEESSPQRTVPRKQKCKTVVVNKRTDTHSGKKHQCDICQEKFTTKSNLNRHLRLHTDDNSLTCKICNIKFFRKINLKKHIKTHMTDEERQLQCDKCSVKFIHKSNLRTHLRLHTEERPFECQICHLRFNLKTNMMNHIRTHTGERPYDCHVCHMKFGNKMCLETHLRIHTGEKPYECQTCPAKFNNRSNLLRHIKTHTGEKPFQCEVCQFRFTQKSDLNRHMSKHTGEKPFECNVCGVRCVDRAYLNRHMKIHSDGRTSRKKVKSHRIRI